MLDFIEIKIRYSESASCLLSLVSQFFIYCNELLFKRKLRKELKKWGLLIQIKS